MISLDRFDPAIQSEDIGNKLRQTVLSLAQEGHAKEEIYNAMDRLLDQVRETHGGAESPEEDIVLDLMDALSGRCHPSSRLL